MSEDSFKIPKLCHHKATSRAYSNWKGKRHYFGKWDSPEAVAAYEKFTEDLQRLHDRILAICREVRTETIRVEVIDDKANVTADSGEWTLQTQPADDRHQHGKQRR